MFTGKAYSMGGISSLCCGGFLTGGVSWWGDPLCCLFLPFWSFALPVRYCGISFLAEWATPDVANPLLIPCPICLLVKGIVPLYPLWVGGGFLGPCGGCTVDFAHLAHWPLWTSLGKIFLLGPLGDHEGFFVPWCGIEEGSS